VAIDAEEQILFRTLLHKVAIDAEEQSLYRALLHFTTSFYHSLIPLGLHHFEHTSIPMTDESRQTFTPLIHSLHQLLDCSFPRSPNSHIFPTLSGNLEVLLFVIIVYFFLFLKLSTRIPPSNRSILKEVFQTKYNLIPENIISNKFYDVICAIEQNTCVVINGCAGNGEELAVDFAKSYFYRRYHVKPKIYSLFEFHSRIRIHGEVDHCVAVRNSFYYSLHSLLQKLEIKTRVAKYKHKLQMAGTSGNFRSVMCLIIFFFSFNYFF
jgi:hypothetical protein